MNRQNVPFVMVANEVLYRRDISCAAKGMFAYLFSKPADWDFAAVRIAAECKEGRKGVLSMLNELEAAGLLIRQKHPDGRMEYSLEYSESQSPLGGPRLFDPKSSMGTVPDRHRASQGPISNKYDPTKKEEESKKENPVASMKYLDAIPVEDMKEFVARFDVSPSKVRSIGEDLVLYCQRKGKVYKNYKAFLLNALKRDCKERPAPKPAPAPEKPLTPEERERQAKKLKEIGDQVRGLAAAKKI